MAKRAKRVKRVRSSTNFSPNWESLSHDLVHSILEKLVYFPDYIRFSAVCKSWNSIASYHKRKHTKLNDHQLPWLLTSSKVNEQLIKFRLYNHTSTAANKISNFQLQIPQTEVFQELCLGSSHGWLFFLENLDSLLAINPLFGTIIRFPPFESSFVKAQKFVLSGDPYLGSNFEVIVVASAGARNGTVVAHLKYGNEFWTYSERFSSFYNFNFTFYKNRILGATCFGQILSVNVSSDDTSRRFEIKAINGDVDFECASVSYLVETTKNDLLMVLRCNICKCLPQVCVKYKVYKLVELNGELECVLVSNLDGHCLFLGKCQPISVLASNYPGCNEDSIYYSYADFNDNGVEEFSLEDQSVREKRNVDTLYRPLWILPSFMNDQVSWGKKIMM
ncbi:uncharacterized protein LOC132803119 [Ziziphus jujuba]|uniref:Uncharacterized protein LOC132803119 n=1 Tax=Ziziphus jujuba TaxID=326968 RepID=A0ABM4A3P9_ZIZJJ|nr:uncharacterized protein LOC132803119 [Ziziphus jujuba]